MDESEFSKSASCEERVQTTFLTRDQNLRAIASAHDSFLNPKQLPS